jgi:hypothetical protein
MNRQVTPQMDFDLLGISAPAVTSPSNSASHNSGPMKKYRALRAIAVFFKVLGVLAVVAGIIGALIFLGAGFTIGSQARGYGGEAAILSSALGAFFIFLYSTVFAVILYAIGEFIRVFIDIEENTRVTNEMLRAKSG